MGTTVSALTREREMLELENVDILRSRDRDEGEKRKRRAKIGGERTLYILLPG